MNILFDPNVAYLLLVGGFLLATLSLFAPGTGVIEIGALFLLALAGFSIANQLINWWALVVLLVGVVPFLLALRRSRRILFLVLALASLIIGSTFLIITPEGYPAVNPFVAAVTSILVGGAIFMISRRVLDAIARPVVSSSYVVGKTGEAKTDILGEGSVYVGGEEWTAHSRTFIPAGSTVVVRSQEGLVIEVEMKS
jgi:membrane-bound serine protease (ClpP class)